MVLAGVGIYVITVVSKVVTGGVLVAVSEVLVANYGDMS